MRERVVLAVGGEGGGEGIIDVLGSGFGLGARTRIDEEEEGEEVTGSGVGRRGVSNGSTQPISDETSGIYDLIGGHPRLGLICAMW
jgi:hypothetical protein